jgi:hypothetical protein
MCRGWGLLRSGSIEIYNLHDNYLGKIKAIGLQIFCNMRANRESVESGRQSYPDHGDNPSE